MQLKRPQNNPLRVGIMQPYFFPYWGHFSLIANTDLWIIFDVTQYMPKSWMNRNRVLHQNDGWQYLSVPLNNSSINIKTQEAKVSSPEKAFRSIQGKLNHYKKSAPFYRETQGVLKAAFERLESNSLVDLNTSSLKAVCEYLNIPFNYRICSELELEFPNSMGPGDWAPFIANHFNATTYLNPIGGKHLFEKSHFDAISCSLNFLENSEFLYDTKGYNFEENLSIIDALMWNSPDILRTAIYSNCSISRA